MSDFKNVMKGGWHPKGKEGGKESWRGDFKGINQVAGWMGKGKQSGSDARSEHVSRPLATLKDPSLFGPPPKNVNYHGGAALPNEITPHRSGIGAPLTQEQIMSARAAVSTPLAQEEEQQSQKPPPPALPYRADRTGLRTDNLPPPPVHRDQRVMSPPPASTTPNPRQTPNLPPRLPSRQNTSTPPPPPPYESPAIKNSVPSSTPLLNASAINRLGNAGVSVPGFGIGNSNKNTAATTTAVESELWKPKKSAYTTPNLPELQSRFAKLNTSNATTSPTTANPIPPATSPQVQAQPQASSWKQTQAALTTANSAYKDPSSVTLADAQAAAHTAQNAQRSANAFRERHNETITAAQTRATQMNKRYNMTGRLNKFLEDANNAHDQQQQQVGVVATPTPTPGVQPPSQQPQQPQPQSQQQPQHQPSTRWPPQPSVSSPLPQSATPELAASISRKPPAPPPPRKPANMQAPPPVPLGTKPNFG